MSTQKAVAILILLMAAFIATNFLFSDKANPITQAKIDAGDIVVNHFTPNQLIKSPLNLSGSAKGTWYFEGVFPIRILDADNKEIARTQAHARGEWMTEGMVPFEATLNFTVPSTSTGTLVFEKDNPSGLPQNSRAMWVPIRFHD